jgi:outer membrane protein assembly factor BamE (lipoprotein component of BamABCDE complex)
MKGLLGTANGELCPSLGYHTELRHFLLTGFAVMALSRMVGSLFAALVALALSGCGLVYKMEINQGNYVTQDMVDRLKEGQTRQQVKFILGTPVTESVFHRDRWDYNFALERRGNKIASHQLVVLFDGDKLKSWDVKDAPKSPMVDRDPAYAAVDPSAKKDDGPGLWDRLTGWWKR